MGMLFAEVGGLVPGGAKLACIETVTANLLWMRLFCPKLSEVTAEAVSERSEARIYRTSSMI